MMVPCYPCVGVEVCLCQGQVCPRVIIKLAIIWRPSFPSTVYFLFPCTDHDPHSTAVTRSRRGLSSPVRSYRTMCELFCRSAWLATYHVVKSRKRHSSAPFPEWANPRTTFSVERAIEVSRAAGCKYWWVSKKTSVSHLRFHSKL